MTGMPGNSATGGELHRAADVGALARSVCDLGRLAVNVVKMAARGINVLKMSKAEPGTAALGTVQKNVTQNKSPKPDFIVGENGTTVPTSRAVLERGFQKAQFPSCSTKSAGTQYNLPNCAVRVMEVSGPAPLRASFEHLKGGHINPFTGKPVQPPKGLNNRARDDFIRQRTHVELTE